MPRHLTKGLLLALISVCIAGCGKDIGSRRIAHAGGGYNGETYTDSFEAMDYNLGRGFRLFEVDFNWTADSRLVCIHDWEESFARFFGSKMENRPTLEEFKSLVRTRSPYHMCTLEELAGWLEDNPDAVIVTDIKQDNLAGLDLIARSITGFEERVIPQIYQPEEYWAAKTMGFRSIIWTLYEFQGDDDAVMSWAVKMKDLYAVTMPAERVKDGLGRRLKDAGFFTYTHTVNEPSVLESCRRNGIDDVYTDFLPPY